MNRAGRCNRSMMADACAKNGRRLKVGEDANKVLREIIVGLLEEGAGEKEIAKATGYAKGSVKHLFHILGIPAHTVRGLSGTATCPCGCNKSWSRTAPGAASKIYFGPGCKYRHVLKRIKANELTPSSYNICPVCQKKFPVYKELEAVRKSYRKTCPSHKCAIEFRRRQIQASETNPSGVFGGSGGATATHEQRRTYCWQVLEWMGPEVPCVNYQETCGAGCYTGDCYKPGKARDIAPERSAIDHSRTVSTGRSR